MLPSLAGMEPVDYVRFVSLVVGFGAAAFSSQKTWVRADVTVCTVLGVGWLCFPHVFLQFQVAGQVSTVHELYGRMFGLSFLLFALPIIQNRRTYDEKVFPTFFLTRAITFLVMLFFILVAHLKTPSSTSHLAWTAKHFWFAGLAAAGWLFGNLRHLVVSGGTRQGKSERSEGDAITYHLFVDIMFLLVGTTFFLAFGGLTTNNFAVAVDPNDVILRHMEQCGAAITLGNCLMALSAHSYDDVDAIKSVFSYRLYVIASFCCLFITYQLLYGLFTSAFFWSLASSYGVFAANSLLAIKYINDNFN